MKFEDAIFEYAAGRFDQLPNSTVPEIVFSGRSNVGKSSLINKLVRRKALARVSATPGKTGTINFYDLKEAKLVDLPGYGYAKVSLSEKQRWANLIEGYLNSQRNITLVVQIIDMRHKPSKDDLHMIDYLITSELPFIIVLTKSDKLNKTKRQEALENIEKEFSKYENLTLLTFSSVTGEGLEKLKDIILSCID